MKRSPVYVRRLMTRYESPPGSGQLSLDGLQTLAVTLGSAVERPVIALGLGLALHAGSRRYGGTFERRNSGTTLLVRLTRSPVTSSNSALTFSSLASVVAVTLASSSSVNDGKWSGQPFTICRMVLPGCVGKQKLMLVLLLIVRLITMVMQYGLLNAILSNRDTNKGIAL